MTTRRPKLAASLAGPNGERVLCGRCGSDLARVIGWRQGEETVRALLILEGWQQADGDWKRWRPIERAKPDIRSGREARLRRDPGRVHALHPELVVGNRAGNVLAWLDDVVIDCGGCGAPQRLDPLELDVESVKDHATGTSLAGADRVDYRYSAESLRRAVPPRPASWRSA